METIIYYNILFGEFETSEGDLIYYLEYYISSMEIEKVKIIYTYKQGARNGN